MTVNKFVAAVVGAVLSAAALGLLPEDSKDYITVAIVFLTAIGVYAVPNKPA